MNQKKQGNSFSDSGENATRDILAQSIDEAIDEVHGANMGVRSTSANFWMLNFGTTKSGTPPRVEAQTRKSGVPKGGGSEGWSPQRVEARNVEP